MNSVTHFEIYGDEPSGLVTFYSRVFGWEIEQMPGIAYWRINTGSAEAKQLNGGLSYRALQDLNGWLLYVQVPLLDETVELIKNLGGSLPTPPRLQRRGAIQPVIVCSDSVNDPSSVGGQFYGTQNINIRETGRANANTGKGDLDFEIACQRAASC